MIGIIYGKVFGLFVEPIARGLRDAIRNAGGDAVILTIEAIAQRDARARQIDRYYVLPFDPPEGREPGEYLAELLLPRAKPIISFAVQDLCWDKIATQERLLGRGLPVPDTVISSDPDDVLAFVREHRFAILKEPRSAAGVGHLVLWIEDGELVGDCGSHRYRVQLVDSGEPTLAGDRFAYPAPYYVQRMVVDSGRRGVNAPQVLRAYVADHQVRFWTERYRESYSRPSDWIVNVSRGARYRFLHDVSDDAKKAALRAADILNLRFGVVDLVRTGSEGPYIIEVDTDSRHLFIDRGFRQLPEYRDIFDFDFFIAQALVADDEAAAQEARDKELPKPPPIARGYRPPRRR
ncbi:MAG TPA: hypothetical protein VEB21_13640 [Terriglobales bacterium]|nr:hypothetical protein [Terriglobales bacterium]